VAITGWPGRQGELRRRGLLERLRGAGIRLRDDGDVAVEPAYRDDADPRAKNRAAIAGYLPREAAMVAGSVAGGERLLILGGDCCAHAGAMAGLRRARPERRLAIAWFDAHGRLQHARHDAVGARLGHAVRDALRARASRTSSRRATARPSRRGTRRCSAGRCWTSRNRAPSTHPRSPISEPACWGTPGGLAALGAWAAAVADEVDGLYVAVDHDVLDAGRSRLGR
jgi:arginase family enzyme